METFLYIVFFISCIVMVVSVLLQPGKTDAGALFTSGVSSAAMNPRGTASVLSKLTIATATIFMLSALLLSLPALTGNVSVLKTQGDDTSSSSTTDTSNSNTENSNSENNSNTESTSDTEEKKEEAADDDKKVEEAKPETEEKSEEKTDDSTEEAKTEEKKEESK